jgi:hypothetical protein
MPYRSRLFGGDLRFDAGPHRAGRGLEGQLPAEVHYLKKVVAYSPAGLAVRQMSLDLQLFAEFERSVNVV